MQHLIYNNWRGLSQPWLDFTWKWNEGMCRWHRKYKLVGKVLVDRGAQYCHTLLWYNMSTLSSQGTLISATFQPPLAKEIHLVQVLSMSFPVTQTSQSMKQILLSLNDLFVILFKFSSTLIFSTYIFHSFSFLI